MINTYTGTLFIRDLPKATVEIIGHGVCKYNTNGTLENKWKKEYTGVKAWDIIEGGKEAEAIEAETDANSVDEYHEYLVLHFEDGTQATFRNSHVTMFIR